jgi:hypothetical protein
LSKNLVGYDFAIFSCLFEKFQGAFGAVYLVKDKKGGEYALKLEQTSEKVKLLKMEVFVMLELRRTNGRHFCDIFDRGRIGNYKFIVVR